jgi:hypothetical protein
MHFRLSIRETQGNIKPVCSRLRLEFVRRSSYATIIRPVKTMKIILPLWAVAILALVGCSTTQQSSDAKADSTSETVMITYHVQQGKEAEFRALLAHGWEVYRGEHFVYASPHTVVRRTESGDQIEFVEIFTWAKSPDHAPASIKAVWKQDMALCEARNGHTAIEGGEVELVTNK